MPGIESKTASLDKMEVHGGLQVKKMHVPHIFKPEGDREFACSTSKLF
jgi:hypothetical protein